MTMRRSWSFWVLVAFLVILYFFLHLALGLGTVVPDLLTIALLLAARRLKAPTAAALGLVLGILRDSLSLVAFGADAITLTLLGYLGSRSRDLFEGDSLVFIGIYLTAGKLLHDLVFYLISGPAPAGGLLRFVTDLPLIIYSAVAGLGALLIYRITVRER